MIHQSLLPLNRRVSMTLFGAGGNGSQMAFGVARLHLAMRALGHPGIHLFIVDPDTVSPSNIVRQLFMPQDVNKNKALVLAHRLNMLYALDFDGLPVTARDAGPSVRQTDLLIGAVDNAKARAQIKALYKKSAATYWLDLGNRASDGQYILGCRNKSGNWLPSVAELFPAIVRKAPGDDETPSCSIAESLSRQELFINTTVSNHALNLLWRLLRYGRVESNGGFVNLATSRCSPLPVSMAAWKRINPVLVSPVLARKAHARKAA